MSFHPPLFSGTLCGPLCVPCPAPAPLLLLGSRKGPIASQAAPLQKESYLGAAHSALSASFSWGSGSGRRSSRNMAESRCVLQPSAPQPRCLLVQDCLFKKKIFFPCSSHYVNSFYELVKSLLEQLRWLTCMTTQAAFTSQYINVAL